MARAIGVLHLQGEIFLTAEHAQINQIPRANAIDSHQPVARLKAKLLADRSRLHRGHHGGLRRCGTGISLQRNPITGLVPHPGSGDLSQCGVCQHESQQNHPKYQSIDHKGPGAVGLQKLQQPSNRQP